MKIMTAQMQSKELVALDDNFKPLEVFSVANGLDPIIEQIKQKVKEQDFDISTKDGRTKMRSFARFGIGGSKKFLKDMSDNLRADWKAQDKAVMDETKRMTDQVDEIRDDFLQPLIELENKEKARIKIHDDNLDYIRDTAIFVGDPTIEQLKSDIEKINNLLKSDFEEFADKRDARAEYSLSVLTIKLNDLVKQKEQAAELEKLRKEKEERDQKDREEKLKQEAADSAKREAEDADAAKIKADADAKAKEAADKAEADRKKIQDEKDEAERKTKEAEAAKLQAQKDADDAVKHEQERVAAEAEAAKIAATKREADVNHRKKINNETLAALVESGISEGDAKLVIQAIARNEIPHVTITY